MPLELLCHCSTKLRVPESAIGKKAKCPQCGAVIAVISPPKPAQDELRILDGSVAGFVPQKECPTCAEMYERDSIACPHCGHQARPAGPRRGPRRGRVAPGVRPRARVQRRSSVGMAWEVVVVLVLLGLGLAGNILQATQGQVNVPGIVVGVLMFLGILGRTGWGWWLTTILAGLAAIAMFAFAAMASGTVPEAVPIFGIIGLFYLGVVGLLISCRARGAY